VHQRLPRSVLCGRRLYLLRTHSKLPSSLPRVPRHLVICHRQMPAALLNASRYGVRKAMFTKVWSAALRIGPMVGYLIRKHMTSLYVVRIYDQTIYWQLQYCLSIFIFANTVILVDLSGWFQESMRSRSYLIIFALINIICVLY